MARNFRTAYALLAAMVIVLAIGIGYPLVQIVIQAFLDPQGHFIGWDNFLRFFSTAGLLKTSLNTLAIGIASTFITTLLAFALAYGFVNRRVWAGGLANALCYLPLYVPSLFPALGLIYLFGNQGLAKKIGLSCSIYGAGGILIGSIIYTLPHALIIISTALKSLDPNLGRAARTLGANQLRILLTVTLPSIKSSLFNAAFVVFIFTITDLGLPLVLGGSFNMLSAEIYKQIIGLQNIPMGATVSLFLLIPTCVLFYASGKARKIYQSKEVVYSQPAPKPEVKYSVFAWLAISFMIVTMLVVVFGSFITFWPYNLSLSLKSYGFQDSIAGMQPYFNSLKLAFWSAFLGVALIFCGGYLSSRHLEGHFLGRLYSFLAVLPLGVPGTVLGLAFVISFNSPSGLFYYFYGTMGLLVFNTVIHFYSVGHFNALAGLASLNPNYEAAGLTLGVSRVKTFFKVILPLQKNNLCELFFYLFINSLTTISSVIFLYRSTNQPASVNILQIYTTNMSEASAMATLLLMTALAAKIVQLVLIRPRLLSSR